MTKSWDAMHGDGVNRLKILFQAVFYLHAENQGIFFSNGLISSLGIAKPMLCDG